MSFDSLGMPEPLARAVADAGYAAPTAVQAAAIPPALSGADLMVAAATGSGKTASFVLPALQRVLAARADPAKRREKGTVYGPRILVLTPTRELALQIAKATATYGRHVAGLRVATVVGGVPYPAQLKALRGPLDVLIATPGRLLDHLQTGKAVLDHVEMLVLDEADRMLDMGFIDDITTIADHVPAARQTVMYSATFLGHVARLATKLLREPQRVDVASHTDTHANIEQRLHWADNVAHKNALLDSILTAARGRAGARLHEHPGRCRPSRRSPRRPRPFGRRAARRHAAGPAQPGAAGSPVAPPAHPRRDRRRGARHRRADDQPRRQLRPADEARGLRASHRPHRPRRPRRARGDARRAFRRRHDPPHPAVHDAADPGRDDRRPRAEEPAAQGVRAPAA